MGKILFISNISNRISSFVTASISAAHNLNIDFYQMANWQNASKEQIFADEQEYDIKIKSVPISRNPFALANLTAYKELVELIKHETIDYINCNTPVGGLLGRLVSKKCKVKKVIYQAHGFHFYKGAPILNWLIYYPVEKLCSSLTDKLITINKEDFELAKNKFKAKEVHYVPGVGIDLSRFENIDVDRNTKRREIGVPEDAFLLLSVGELNENKNHQVVIRALAKLKNPDAHYLIAGLGDKKDYLLDLAKQLGVSEQVHLLGYRRDIEELIRTADVFCFPCRKFR